ncbi:hypothetical protein E4U10_007848 [Claviceps purpurea]|nr:hypothetical protein E4U10_007848 [Claviceps purpurea]
MATLSTIAHPQYSSDSEPPSPTNLQRTKRQRAVHTTLNECSTQGSAAVARVAPPKAKTKEDIRVLVTVAEGAPRPEPFQLRHKLVTMLKGSPSDIQHVRRTPGCYAIQPAPKLVRDRLVVDDLKQELSRTFDASKVCLPEKWFTHAVQDVLFTLMLGPAEYASTSDLIEEEVNTQTGQKPAARDIVSRDIARGPRDAATAGIPFKDTPRANATSLPSAQIATALEKDSTEQTTSLRQCKRGRRAKSVGGTYDYE